MVAPHIISFTSPTVRRETCLHQTLHLPSIELLKAIQISNCSQQHTHRAEDLILAFDPKIEKGMSQCKCTCTMYNEHCTLIYVINALHDRLNNSKWVEIKLKPATNIDVEI